MQVNFELQYTTSACPHKHDLRLSVPNEFMVLPPDTMVVAIFRLFSYAMHLIKACGLHPEYSGTGFKRGWGVLHL